MNLFISTAYAAGEAAGTAAAGGADVPSAGEAFMLNMLMILILVVLFYVLLILPQQKRLKKHQEMLGTLKKGDKIITAGGLIGKVDKIVEDKNEIVVDLGGQKVTAVRSTIQRAEEE